MLGSVTYNLGYIIKNKLEKARDLANQNDKLI